MTHEEDIIRTHSAPVMHLKGLIFGMLFSSPFWAILAYCYWWVR